MLVFSLFKPINVVQSFLVGEMTELADEELIYPI